MSIRSTVQLHELMRRVDVLEQRFSVIHADIMSLRAEIEASIRPVIDTLTAPERRGPGRPPNPR